MSCVIVPFTRSPLWVRPTPHGCRLRQLARCMPLNPWKLTVLGRPRYLHQTSPCLPSRGWTLSRCITLTCRISPTRGPHWRCPISDLPRAGSCQRGRLPPVHRLHTLDKQTIPPRPQGRSDHGVDPRRGSHATLAVRMQRAAAPDRPLRRPRMQRQPPSLRQRRRRHPHPSQQPRGIPLSRVY